MHKIQNNMKKSKELIIKKKLTENIFSLMTLYNVFNIVSFKPFNENLRYTFLKFLLNGIPIIFHVEEELISIYEKLGERNILYLILIYLPSNLLLELNLIDIYKGGSDYHWHQ